MKSNDSQHSFDLIIVGGAMAGATLALAISQLTNNKLSIALIEAKAINYDHQGFDARSIALSLASCKLLDSIKLWQPLASIATPIEHIHVSNQGHAGITEFNAIEEQLDYLGQVIELAEAGQIFYKSLAQCSNVALFCPAKVSKIAPESTMTKVTLNDNTVLSAKLVVAADGGQSSSCAMLGIASTEHDFNQVAIISNVLSSQKHEFRAFERFTEQGPIALLPMSRERNSLVWCCRPEKAQQIMELDKEAFLAKLQQIFGWRLGRFKQCSIPQSYPLVLRQATRIVTHRAVVIGNAAQTLHPIAGQGFNLALRDVMTLAKEVSLAFEQKQDWGSMPVLQRYRRQRECDRNLTVGLISSLVYAFSNRALPLLASRNLGLMTLSASKELKKPLMRQLMGLNSKIDIKG